MSKITLEITEVVNGVSITETPITLVGDTLSAAASTTATGVTFTPTGDIAATNVQAALAELDSEKVSSAGGATAVTFNATGDIAATNVQAAIAELDTEKLSLSGGTMTGAVKFTDSQRIQLGDGFDFQMYHDGSNSYLRDFGVGDLIIQATNLQMLTTAGESYIQCASDGSVALYYNNVSKANTSASGLNVNGTLTTTSINASGLIEFNSLRGTGIAAVTTILDEDNMSSNSDTALSTQQSIKAYVDSQVASVPVGDITTVTAGNGLSGGGASGDVSLSIDNSIVVTKLGTQTLTNKTLTSPDINGGTVDGATVGATTPAAGSFTTLGVSGDITAGGTVDGRDLATDGAKLDNIAANATANVGDITNVITGNGLTGGGTSGAVTVAVDTAVVATASNTLSLNNKTLNTPVLNSVDINGGTMDNVTIGGTQKAAGSFTDLTATGQVTVTNSTPSIVWNDTDGNERNSIFHAGGVAYYTSIDSDETFGTHRFRRDTESGAPINVFETLAAGDVKFYKANGTNSLLKLDAVNSRVGIGVESPKTDFQIGSSTASVAMLLAGNNGSATSSQLLFSDNVAGADPYESGMGVRFDSTANALHIDDNHNSINNSRVTVVRDTGNVGINTSTPAEKLDVVGTAKATQLNIRTGTSLDTVATLSDDSNLTSWKITDQSYYTGTGAGGPASNAGLQSAPTGFFVVDNDTSANASTINGFKAFLIGSNNSDGVDEYTLGSAYNIGNMTFVNRKTGLGDNNPQDVEVHNNGQYVFVLGNNNNRLRRFTLATAYDIDSLSLATSGDDQIQNFTIPNTNVPTGFTFGGSGSDYGKKLYVVDSTEDNLQEFALTNAFDISSGVSLVRSIDINDATKGLVMSCTSVRFSADGTKVYLSDNAAGDDITRLNLATPWDISTTSYHEAFYVGAADLSISGIDIAGTEIYTVDTATDTVRQYTSNNTGVVLNADSLHIPGSIRVTNDITASRLMRVDGQLRATGGTTLAGTTITGALTLTSATGAIRLGSESATGEFKVGRSTKTHTIDIHDGATESGETATVNIGTSGASGSTTNINIGGGVGTCTTTIDGDLVIPNETPASATAAGTAGQIVWDTDYIYICTATNTWKRVAIGTW
jgi:hypothetical protein